MRATAYYFYCNRPAGFHGRCVRQPNHSGNCSVESTPRRKMARAMAAAKFAEKLWKEYTDDL